MAKQDYILVRTLCVQYKVEVTFFKELDNIGLIKIETFENEEVILVEKITDVEKMIRLHHELNVNIEGIDVVFNLLEKERQLQDELNDLKNKLRRFENE